MTRGKRLKTTWTNPAAQAVVGLPTAPTETALMEMCCSCCAAGGLLQLVFVRVAAATTMQYTTTISSCIYAFVWCT